MPTFSRFAAFAYLILAITVPTAAQRPADDWTRFLERSEGWLGADGIYSVDMNADAKTADYADPAAPVKLFLFSDTIAGTTRDEAREFDKKVMTNHSFAILADDAPNPGAAEFVWHEPGDVREPGDRPRNVVDGYYWLQDGIRYGDKLWLTAILVGRAWKPDRIDALSFPVDPQTHRPDFSDPKVDDRAPLSLRTDDAQVVLGAAINDETDDGYLYVYGYVDRFREGSRKDAVVARVTRERLEEWDQWTFFDGREWRPELETLLDPNAVLAAAVSAEFSVTRVPAGESAGKWLLVYTPRAISEKVAFRVGDSPVGPFGEEHVFWSSTVPEELPGVRCYNAKAHPALSGPDALLVSYNVNRLGDEAHKPAEYRPRFLWLDWKTIDDAVRADDHDRR